MWRRMNTWARKTLSTFRASLISISDPRIGRLFGYGVPNYSGAEVNETSALGLSAVYRAVDLITGTLAQLPMPTLREVGPKHYQQTKSFLDDPGGVVGLNPFVWKRIVYAHLSLYNEAFLRHVYGGAGQLLGLLPIHPGCVTVTWARPSDAVQPVGGKWYDITLIDGTQERHDASTLTQPMGLTLDGLRGLWITSIGRNSLGTAIAGDRAAANMFGSGMSVSALVTPDEDSPSWDDANEVKAIINSALTGPENQGGVAVLNRKLKVQQMQMSAEDAQFLESRQFSIEEVARWFGVPPFELMQTDKQTSWGTGVESQQRGLGRQTLAPKAKCLEDALSTLLPSPRFVRVDFAEMERPAPDRITEQAIAQWNAGLITKNEARVAMGFDPIADGEATKSDGAAAAVPEEAAA